MEAPATRRVTPVGVRFICEDCGEETVLALPGKGSRLGMVDCPSCSTTYLVMLRGDDAAERESSLKSSTGPAGASAHPD